MGLFWKKIADLRSDAAVKTINDFLGSAATKINALEAALASANTALSAKVIAPTTNTEDYIPQWNGADSKTLKDGVSLASLLTKTYVGTITRNQTSNAANIQYTGLGFKPKIVKFLASNGAANIAGSIGFDNGVTHSCMYMLPTINNVQAASFYVGDAATWSVYGIIATMDDDGFTLAWLKAGTPPAGTVTLTYEAIG